MVFQELALWTHMRAWENVEFMLPRHLRGKRERREKAFQMLNEIGLSQDREKFPRQLSRGEQQRLALARALACEPSLLLLDEPFSSQDSEVKDQLMDYISEVRRASGLSMIYVTHALEELPRVVDRTVVLRNGTIHSFSKEG